jgi:hypothetical protein
MAEWKSKPKETSERCSSCRQVKPLEDFHRSPVSRDGRAARCKECRNADARVYRERRARAEKETEERGRLAFFAAPNEFPVDADVVTSAAV